MLDLLRKNSRNWGVMTIMIVATMSMVFFFGNYNRGQRKINRSWVAEVNGKKIPYIDFYRKYNNVVHYYRQQMGENFSEKILEMYGIKKQILDAMISDNLIYQEAINSNIPVIDQEIRDMIFSYPYFQKDGKFSLELYKKLLPRMRTTVKDFERNQKTELAKNKVESLIINGINLSDTDIKYLYKIKKSKISFKFLEYDPNSIIVKVNKNEKNMFLKNNINKIKTYYKNNNNSFIIPEKISLGWLLIKPNGVGPEAKEKAKRKIEGLALGLTKDNFFTITKKYTEASAEGKYLNIIKGTIDTKIEEKAFNMAKGDISSVFETENGFNIVYLFDKKESFVRSFDIVKMEIAEKLLKLDKKAEILNKKLSIVNKTKSSKRVERLFKSKFKKSELKLLDNEIVSIPNTSSTTVSWLFSLNKKTMTYKKIGNKYYVFYVLKKMGFAPKEKDLISFKKEYLRELGGEEFVMFKKNLFLKHKEDIVVSKNFSNKKK